MINSQSLGVSPQHLQGIILAVLFVEDMHHDVDKIHKYPSALLITRLAEPLETRLLATLTNIIDNSPSLTITGSGRDYKIICCRAQTAQIQNRYVGAV